MIHFRGLVVRQQMHYIIWFVNNYSPGESEKNKKISGYPDPDQIRKNKDETL
jgi:hypothetical protein